MRMANALFRHFIQNETGLQGLLFVIVGAKKNEEFRIFCH
jgi:hypothetical protein